MVIAMAVVMTLGAFIAVAYPFITRNPGKPVTVDRMDLREANYQRDHTYAQLKELENDYASGTLSREDYQRLEAKYRNQAVHVLREIDDIQSKISDGDAGEDIEAEIAGLRQGKKKAVAFCAYCGSRRQSEGAYCPDCGRRYE